MLLQGNIKLRLLIRESSMSLEVHIYLATYVLMYNLGAYLVPIWKTFKYIRINFLLCSYF